IMTVASSVGARCPAHLPLMGRVVSAVLYDPGRDDLLIQTDWSPRSCCTMTQRRQLEAELTTITDQRWSMIDRELEEGLRSIATPLRTHDGRTIAAVNISASTRRGTPEIIQADLLPLLLKTASGIEHDLAAVAYQS